MWLKEINRYICNIENFAYGEINERNFSNPIPGEVFLQIMIDPMKYAHGFVVFSFVVFSFVVFSFVGVI